MNDVLEGAAIKETTERVLDIRTGLLGVRGEQVAAKDSAIFLLNRNMADAMSMAHNEQDRRLKCEDDYLRLQKKTSGAKLWKFLEGIAVGVGVGIILAQ